MDQLLISVIIPVYNTERYINETIKSVIEQTYSNWEIIAINDGSTDNSFSLLTDMAKNDSRIKIYDIPNGGVSNARNTGINIANGELIALLDADDTWEIDNLAKKVAVLENPTIDWVYSDASLIDEKSTLIGDKKGDDTNILNDYLEWNKTVVPGPCSNIVVKRKCFENNLQFDSTFSTAADQDFCFNLSTNYKGKRISENLWNYRILPNSMSRNISVMEKDHIGVYKKAAKNKLFKGFWHKQKCFSNLYLILAGSWWKNGQNKSRGLLFIVKAVFNYPPTFFKLFQKSLKQES